MPAGATLSRIARATVTVVVPSYNQGDFLERALRSIDDQGVTTEVFLMDGGSTDSTTGVIERWQHRLSAWRSYPDDGQAAAINEGVARGSAPFVCWLNSDDWLLPQGLTQLVQLLSRWPRAAMAFGRTLDYAENTGRMKPALVVPFYRWIMARVCTISQPGTLIRRSAWEAVGGLDSDLSMAMDYDLWWRLYLRFGKPLFLNEYVAVNRDHWNTKTNTRRSTHYREAMMVVRRHYGTVPFKWWLAQPYAVWLRSRLRR